MNTHDAKNALKGTLRYLDACLGIEYTVDPDAICPGAPPVVLGLCQKPGPHGRHRCGDPPVYEDGQR